MADELTAIMIASDEIIVEVPEVAMSASIVTIEQPNSDSAIESAQQLVFSMVEAETEQPDSDEIDIVVEPVPKVGFVKRWTRKIVGWVKRVFNWRKG